MSDEKECAPIMAVIAGVVAVVADVVFDVPVDDAARSGRVPKKK